MASGLLATMWSQQGRLIYCPSPGPVPSAAAVLPTGRDVVLGTEDGIRLGAWYFPGRAEAVLVCNGNAGDRSMRADLAVALNAWDCRLFDYRGYGGNPSYRSGSCWCQAGHDDPELLDGSQMINAIKGFLASTDMT